jgi:hypothetical protein
MHVVDSQKVLPDFLMKTSGSPFGDRADERSIRFSAPGEALIHTDLVLNFFFLIMCRNLAVNAPSAQLPGKFTAAKNTFPSGPYAKTLLTIVSQS